MAKYGSPDVTVSVGGTDMTAHTMEIGGVKIAAILEESHPFGTTWFEALAVGIKRMEDLTLGGFYDDTATSGPDAKYGGAAIGTTVAVVITYGSTKTTSFNGIIADYERRLVRNQLHRYTVTLRPTGTVTEA